MPRPSRPPRPRSASAPKASASRAPSTCSFRTERLVALRRLILSEDEDDRAKALTGLVDYQTGDYAAIFSTMAGRPVTVRLFDPPLHEFLPRTDEDIEETAASLGLATKALRLRLDRLSEVNPMLGHRGVRLAITYPEILAMQMQALIAGVRAGLGRAGRARRPRGHGALRLDRAAR